MMVDPLPSFHQHNHPHHHHPAQQQTLPSLLHPPISPNHYTKYSTSASSVFSAAATSPYSYARPTLSNSSTSTSTSSSDVSLPPLRMHMQTPPPPSIPSHPVDPALSHSHALQYYQPLPPIAHQAPPSASMLPAQVAAAQVAATLADLAVHKPPKEIKRRTKTGCLTCRKRRIKCDERHPMCYNCLKSKRVCLGYDPVFKPQRVNKKDDKDRSGSDSPTIMAQPDDSECKRIKIDSLLTE